MKKLFLSSLLFVTFSVTTLCAQSLNVVSNSVVESTTTSATGTSFVRLPTYNALQVRVTNNTGTTLVFQFYGTGKAMPVPDATQFIFRGITNSNQLFVRRNDNNNTPVTFYYIIER